MVTFHSRSNTDCRHCTVRVESVFDIFTVLNSSCGKVMFSEVCVKNSVCGGWGEGVVCPIACRNTHTPWQRFYVHMYLWRVNLMQFVNVHHVYCRIVPYFRQGLSDKRYRHLFSNRPDLAYHLIQTVFYGALAVTTLRYQTVSLLNYKFFFNFWRP